MDFVGSVMQLQLRSVIQTSGSDLRGATHSSCIAHLSGISRMNAYGTKDKGAQGHGKAFRTSYWYSGGY